MHIQCGHKINIPFESCIESLIFFQIDFYLKFYLHVHKLCFPNSKGKIKLIIRRADIVLWHITNISATCIVLHNICIIGKDKFDMK